MVLATTAISLTLVATPVFAQTFKGFYNNDPAVTQGYAPYQDGGYSNGLNNGVPIIGPVCRNVCRAVHRVWPADHGMPRRPRLQRQISPPSAASKIGPGRAELKRPREGGGAFMLQILPRDV